MARLPLDITGSQRQLAGMSRVNPGLASMASQGGYRVAGALQSAAGEVAQLEVRAAQERAARASNELFVELSQIEADLQRSHDGAGMVEEYERRAAEARDRIADAYELTGRSADYYSEHADSMVTRRSAPVIKEQIRRGELALAEEGLGRLRGMNLTVRNDPELYREALDRAEVELEFQFGSDAEARTDLYRQTLSQAQHDLFRAYEAARYREGPAGLEMLVQELRSNDHQDVLEPAEIEDALARAERALASSRRVDDSRFVAEVRAQNRALEEGMDARTYSPDAIRAAVQDPDRRRAVARQRLDRAGRRGRRTACGRPTSFGARRAPCQRMPTARHARPGRGRRQTRWFQPARAQSRRPRFPRCSSRGAAHRNHSAHLEIRLRPTRPFQARGFGGCSYRAAPRWRATEQGHLRQA